MSEVELKVGDTLVGLDASSLPSLYLDMGVQADKEYVVAEVTDRYVRIEGVKGLYTIKPDRDGDSWKTFYKIKE